MLSAELRGLVEQRHIKAPPIMSGVPAPLNGARLAVRGGGEDGRQSGGSWVVVNSSFGLSEECLSAPLPLHFTHEKM